MVVDTMPPMVTMEVPYLDEDALASKIKANWRKHERRKGV